MIAITGVAVVVAVGMVVVVMVLLLKEVGNILVLYFCEMTVGVYGHYGQVGEITA